MFGNLEFSIKYFSPLFQSSFADMWVDFLLKETEEREKRDSATVTTGKSTQDSHGTSPNTNSSSVAPPFSNQRMSTGTSSPLSVSSSPNPNPNPNPSPPPRGYFHQSERLSSEFSTVPLTSSSDSKTYSSKLLPRY